MAPIVIGTSSAPTASLDEAHADDSAPGAVRRVVLIDPRDERRAITGGLVDRCAGLTVVGVAATLDEAETLIRAEQPDVALMEIQMPVAHGLETIRTLRDQFPDLRIVVSSFHNDPATRAAALMNGADGYLTKPLLIEDLLLLTAGPAPAAGPRPEAELEVLSDTECRTLLRLAAMGRIGVIVDGLPIILPVNYRLLSDDAGTWLVLRTKPGNTIDQASQEVAFEIDGVDYDNRRGWSVLVRGTLHHLDHNEIELLTKRFDPRPWPQDGRTSWLAIKPRAISGRRLHPAEREWAYHLDT